ncbi:MAG: flagellar hook-basal body complex protein FliE [Planctomycetota bacterium]|jgi:flagellar hook-basal body complex protein FliE
MSEFNVEAASRKIAEEFKSIGSAPKSEDTSAGGSFKNVLSGYLQETNDMQQSADQSLSKLVRGETDNVHEVMLAMSKADVSFRMMLEVRNKLVEAYKEVMRMQV